MFHMAAFYENIDLAGAYGELAGVADQVLTVVGDDIRIPELDNLVFIAFGIGSGGTPGGRLTSPTLRKRVLPVFEPTNGGADAGAEPDSPPAVHDLRRSPMKLTRNEQLNAQARSNTTIAEEQWAVVGFATGKLDPLEGDMFTVRFTGTTTLVAGAWTNGAIVLDEDLEPGVYQVVGMRARSTGLIAARLVFPGTGAGGWRPGCLGVDDENDLEHEMFRYGGLGVWGQFNEQSPPTVDYLALSADTAETGFLDLIKAG
jgi:hypothetical protein